MFLGIVILMARKFELLMMMKIGRLFGHNFTLEGEVYI